MLGFSQMIGSRTPVGAFAIGHTGSLMTIHVRFDRVSHWAPDSRPAAGA
jgi:hypothetical protein